MSTLSFMISLILRLMNQEIYTRCSNEGGDGYEERSSGGICILRS